MHRREGLPVEADGAFAAPIWFEGWIADAAAVGMERSTLDPPGPGVFGDRQCGWRLHWQRLVKVGGAGAWRGDGECYNRSAREEGETESVSAVLHLIHPCSESFSTIACIGDLTPLLRCI